MKILISYYFLAHLIFFVLIHATEDQYLGTTPLNVQNLLYCILLEFEGIFLRALVAKIIQFILIQDAGSFLRRFPIEHKILGTLYAFLTSRSYIFEHLKIGLKHKYVWFMRQERGIFKLHLYFRLKQQVGDPARLGSLLCVQENFFYCK